MIQLDRPPSGRTVYPGRPRQRSRSAFLVSDRSVASWPRSGDSAAVSGRHLPAAIPLPRSRHSSGELSASGDRSTFTRSSARAPAAGRNARRRRSSRAERRPASAGTRTSPMPTARPTARGLGHGDAEAKRAPPCGDRTRPARSTIASAMRSSAIRGGRQGCLRPGSSPQSARAAVRASPPPPCTGDSRTVRRGGRGSVDVVSASAGPPAP